MTYISLAIATALLGLVIMIIARRRLHWSALLIAALALMLMTLVFDNLIILSGIVDYDEAKISGVKLWLAPIEDFSYTLFALGLVPAIWEALGKRK
jgi:lycopene cyclase domain-containing protein